MSEHVFELDNFRGPLDLLLHLIREQEMDITDVDLGTLCDQYLAVIEQAQRLDVDVAGEFLVMASTLVLIKSRALLPTEEVDLAQELDPEDELILQLLEYRRFKALSMELGQRAGDRARRHGRAAPEAGLEEGRELAEISLWDLVGSFARLVEELGLHRDIHTLRAEKPLRETLREIVGLLSSRNEWVFRDLLAAMADTSGVYVTFLALLELVRSGQVDVRQERPSDPIQLMIREDRDEDALASLLAAGEHAPDPEPLASREGDAIV